MALSTQELDLLRAKVGMPMAGSDGAMGAGATYANDGAGGAPAAPVDNSGDPKVAEATPKLQNFISPVTERGLDLADPPLATAVEKLETTGDAEPVRDLLKERGIAAPRPRGRVGIAYVDPYRKELQRLGEDPFMGGAYVPASVDEGQAMLSDAMFADAPEQADKWLARKDSFPEEYERMQRTSTGQGWKLGRMRDAAQARQAAYQVRGAESEATGYERSAAAGQEAMAQLEQREAAFERRQQAYRAASAEQMDKYRKATEQARDFKIDPDRYMSSKGAFGQFRITIALMLGAASASLGKHPNQALEMLNRRIDQDIDAQKAELGNKRAYAKDQQNILGIMRTQFADERQAEMAARQFIKERLLLEVEQIGQGAKAGTVKAKADGLKAAIADDLAAGEQQRLLQATQQHEALLAQLEQERRAMLIAQAGAAAKRAEQERLAAQGVIDVRDLKGPERQSYVHGIGLVLNKDDRDKLLSVSLGYQDLAGNNRVLRKALNSGSPEDLGRAQAALMANMESYNQLFGDGSALEDGKMKAYGDAFGGAAAELAKTGNLSGATMAKLEHANRMAQAKLNRLVRASAVLPGTVSPDGKKFYQTGHIGGASSGGVNFQAVK